MTEEIGRQKEVNWEAIATQIRDKDEAAIAAFAHQFGAQLRRFLVMRGLKGADAEELAVETLGDIILRVSDGRYRPQGIGSFTGWCFALARNKLTDWHRSRRHVVFDADIESHAVDSSADALDDGETEVEKSGFSAVCHAVRETLESMAETDRDILLLRHCSLFGATFREIGDALDISKDAARTRYHRARGRLASQLNSVPVVSHWLEERGGQDTSTSAQSEGGFDHG